MSQKTNKTNTQAQQQQQRVAIIGGGVSGLSAAWHLQVNGGGLDPDDNGNNKSSKSKSNPFQVHVFEAAPRLGGHAHTLPVRTTTTPTTSTSDDDGNGHTTKSSSSSVDVDIGFMVFNHENYPNLVQWFRALGVPEQDSNMSLSVSLDGGDTVEWTSSNGLDGLFANRRAQIASPAFYSFLRDMMRFHREAPALLAYPPDDPRVHVTTEEYLRTHQYGTPFTHYYLLPMMAALWSASLADVLQFPAAQLVGFLNNHQMLQIFDRPQWKTVAGRSQQYTHKLRDEILVPDRTHLATAVTKVVRQEATDKNKNGAVSYLVYGKSTTSGNGNSPETLYGEFDHVVFACHAPTAQAILEAGGHSSGSSTAQTENNGGTLTTTATTTPPPNRLGITQLLSQVSYADNVVYVHSDPALMPARKRAWASWNCLGQTAYMPGGHGGANAASSSSSSKVESFEGGASGFGNKLAADLAQNGTGHHGNGDTTTAHLEGEQGRMKAVYVTYWLNRLQSLDTEQDIFVSLNPHQRPDPALTHERLILAHPQFHPATLQAREAILAHHQGKDNLWFCGAWQGYGFHEDGCRSGFQVATALSGVPLPWATNASEEPVLNPPDLSKAALTTSGGGTNFTSLLTWPLRATRAVSKFWTRDVPVYLCKRFVLSFLAQAVQHGQLVLEDASASTSADKPKERYILGDGKPCGCDDQPVVMRIFDDWFYVKVATEYDLGLARSYMAGHFNIQALANPKDYHPVIRPPSTPDETTMVLGDPIGLTRMFLLLIGNRDAQHVPRKAARGHWYSNALTNASGLVISRIGSFLNYVRYKLTMDNSEHGGSMKNIHAHYDLSNDLFRTFLDKQTLMYSSAIYDAVRAPSPLKGLTFRGSLEEAQWRKLDTLLARAQVQPGQTLLDIGFGWGGLSLHAAKKYGCRVTGITLSVEQKALATERVREQGLQDLITFEVIDYRTFARQKRNLGKFDRVLSCEMIEAVGHEHLGEFFWAVEQVLAPDGILVMEAITTPEQRYETYLRSTDFINTIIFPGSCCPSLHALVDAAYQQSCLTLEHVDNIGLHYAETLAEWRRRFNANESTVRQLGFDNVFLRVWNYYLTYCEAGFFSQTENCLILVFARQGCSSLAPLCETRSVTQADPLTDKEVQNWMTDTS